MANGEGYDTERSRHWARLKPRHGFVMGPPGVASSAVRAWGCDQPVNMH